MSEYLYLTDRNLCPGCRVHRSPQSGNCHNCGLRLFVSPPTDPKKFEDETGIRHWWAYTASKGWIHRDHIMIEGLKLNERHYVAPVIPKDYGLKTTPGDVVARKSKSKRIRRKSKITPTFKKVYG